HDDSSCHGRIDEDAADQQPLDVVVQVHAVQHDLDAGAAAGGENDNPTAPHAAPIVEDIGVGHEQLGARRLRDDAGRRADPLEIPDQAVRDVQGGAGDVMNSGTPVDHPVQPQPAHADDAAGARRGLDLGPATDGGLARAVVDDADAL